MLTIEDNFVSKYSYFIECLIFFVLESIAKNKIEIATSAIDRGKTLDMSISRI